MNTIFPRPSKIYTLKDNVARSDLIQSNSILRGSTQEFIQNIDLLTCRNIGSPMYRGNKSPQQYQNN